MRETFFESIHSASVDCPYVDTEMRNIKYLSHFHTEIELILVKWGSVDITCEGKSFSACEGDVCIFMPGEIHSFASPCENHLYIVKLYCRNSAEKTDFTSLRIKGNTVCAEHRPVLAAKLESLAAETKSTELGHAYAANSIAADIVAYILRKLHPVGIAISERKRHLSEVALLEQVNGLIESRYFESIELDDAAKYCKLSKYYFAHLFKSAVGTTFWEYLTQYRLERSMPMLLDTSKKISEIALDCGFSNIRSYNRAFRRIYGKAPGEYRNSHKLGENQ